MGDTAGLILAIDQGTTNTKVLLVNRRGEVIAQASRALILHYPQSAWVEQDALSLWQSVREAMNECLALVDHPPEAIALTNQRESALLWERQSGQPLGPAIVWQCRRTADFCASLRENGLAPVLMERTGLAIDPLFSASKMRWLLEHCADGVRRAERGELALGTVDSWVLRNLTGGLVHACDFTMPRGPNSLTFIPGSGVKNSFRSSVFPDPPCRTRDLPLPILARVWHWGACPLACRLWR